MALDPELRALLEAMEQRIDQRAAARDAETRQRVNALAATVGSLTASVGSLSTNVGSLATEVKATRAVAEAALSVAVQARDESAATRRALEAKIDEVQRQAGAARDAIIHEIKALPDGLSTAQRQEADHLDADREEQMLTQHVLPLEASATAAAAGLTRHQQRINDHETRIQVVEKR